MCDPVSAAYAAVAIAAAGAYVQYDEGQKSAKRQEQAIQDGLAKDRAATQRMYSQINESAQDEQAARHTEYLIDAARIKTIQGESGLAGATFDRQQQENQDKSEADMATIEKNRQWSAVNANSQSQARGTQASIQLSGIRKPSALGAGLQIAGAGVSSYDSYKKSTDPNYASAGKTK